MLETGGFAATLFAEADKHTRTLEVGIRDEQMRGKTEGPGDGGVFLVEELQGRKEALTRIRSIFALLTRRFSQCDRLIVALLGQSDVGQRRRRRRGAGLPALQRLGLLAFRGRSYPPDSFPPIGSVPCE